MNIQISRTAIGAFYKMLFASSVVLILATALSDLQGPFANTDLLQRLDLKREGNIAVWYSSTLLLLVAMAALLAGRSVAGRHNSVWWQRHIWTLAALFFCGLSMDETAQLHEKAAHVFTSRVGRIPFLTEGGSATPAWLVVLFPLIAAFFACIFAATRCWRGLYPGSRKLVLAAVACWSGVLAAEFVEAQMVRLSVPRSFQGAIEEGLELTGAMLFLMAFLEVLAAGAPREQEEAAAAASSAQSHRQPVAHS